jgi:cytosine deaminase
VTAELSAVLSNARLHDDSLVDIGVVDGLVVEVARAATATGPHAVDIGGWLVLPAPAEPHAHLDKALLGERFSYAGGGLAASIEQIRSAYDHLDDDDIRARARRAALASLAHGCTEIRTHADCGEAIGVRAVRAVLDVRAELRDVVGLSVTALPNPQITGPEGRANRAALELAIELGADSVGGCPDLDDDPVAAVDLYVSIAAAAGLPLDLHIDETLDPSARSLRLLATRVLDSAFPHRVSASHCVSLGTQSESERTATIRLVREAGIAVIACPQTNLLLQGRGSSPGNRGIVPITQLQEAGVVVAGGGDNWRDPFNPLGRMDPLETASLLVSAAHLTPTDAYTAVSDHARAAMGLPTVGPTIGSRADLIAVPSRDIAEFVASATLDRVVIRGGTIAARSSVQRWTAADPAADR